MTNDKLIHKRKSYSEFAEWLKFLNTKPSKAEILRRVFSTVDNHRGYGSNTQSDYAKESLELLIQEEHVE